MEVKMIGNINPDGRQNEVIALKPYGHNVVLGTAGSGKTTMALLRAIGLSNLPSSPNVLVVTFNGALVQYMDKIINRCYKNITIENFHRFARGYLNSRGKMPRYNGILNSDTKEELIRCALSHLKDNYPEESTLQRPLTVFVDEITFIQNFGFANLKEYVSAERIGRSSANIKRENRKWFYAVFEKYKELREKDGYLYDWDDLAFYTYWEFINDNEKRRYDHIIVDEGQDFSPMMIKTLTVAVNKSGSFSFFGDVAQQIYGSRLSWRDSGISVKDNKIWRFDCNYRNPTNISLFANDITESEFWSSKDDMVSPTKHIAEGPKPVLLKFSNIDNETTWLISQIKNNIQTSSNVIICRNRLKINYLKKLLNKSGVSVKIIDKDNAGFATVKGVYLSTFHAAKGLEFENVFIPFLSNQTFPDMETINSASDKKRALADELKLLYVAVTRSKYGLFMSFHNELSELFPYKSKNYDYIKEDEL